MEEIEEFLKSRGLTEEQLLKMKEQKIEPTIISLMDDMQLAEFIPKFGDRIALRQFCKLQSQTECSISNRKQSLLENLRQKLKNNSKGDGNLIKAKKTRTYRAPPDNKQIEIGWLCCLDEDSDKYVQVREVSGGGTRKIKVPKDANKEIILEKGINLFFPNGKSTKGEIDEFIVDLFDFKRNRIETNITVEEILEATALTKLRFYVATKKKKQNKNKNTDVVCEDVLLETDNNDCCTVLTSNTDDQNNAALTYNDLSFEIMNTLDPQVVSNSDESTYNFVNWSLETPCKLREEMNMLLNSVLDGTENANKNNLNTKIEMEESDEPRTLQEILKNLQDKIDYSNLNKFNVFRNDIFNCCIRAMRRKTFRPFNKISVKFSDCEGVAEGAIDEGGPTRELFRLVLKFIKNSQLFTGALKKNISLHNNSLKEKLYYETGRLISLSLVHGGSGPHFFSETVYSMLTVGVQNTFPTLDDVDVEIRNKLILFKETVNLPELQEIVASENIFSIAGCHYIKNIDEKCKIFDDTLKFYALKRVEEPLNQLIEGLQTCGIYEKMKTYPHLFKDVFCNNKIKVTSEIFEKIFDVEYSEIGSNRRELENRAISYFRDYVLDCEENSADENEEPVENNVTVTDILVFVTGADCVPPLGFPVTPKITFLHDENKYPMANTCALQLKLPTLHMNYDEFKVNMSFGIGNAKSFGFA